ncbi:hypothetical protein [Flavobacterium sp. ACAM 123]|uniref:hypothetical protein n=1 Tax=Flavobacterium sp. ACAM 123 TaxID=1189620 RepID=UPI00031DD206|nr:hypothetical protein [Flavobacterium sp. ACAM 123]
MKNIFKSKNYPIAFVYAMLVAVLFSATSCKKEELYTSDECSNFKKGDTVFTKESYTIKKRIVINNFPENEIIEVRDLKYTWDINILSYDDFRFKE